MRKETLSSKKKAGSRVRKTVSRRHQLTDKERKERAAADSETIQTRDRERLFQERTEELRIHQIELEMQNEELRSAQQLLETSRRKYADLYDFAPIGYLSLDSQGLIQEVNFTGARLLGYEKNFLLARLFPEFIATRKDKNRFEEHKRIAFSSGTRQSCELQLVRKDGGSFHAQLESIANMQSAAGTGELIMTAITDITERRRTEGALKESEERYRNLVNFIPLGMILVRGNRVCWANNAALSLFGAGSQRELQDKSLFDLCPPACHEQIEQYIEDLKRGMPVRTTEQRIIRIDGTELHVEASLAYFVTDQGFSFLATLNDISSRKQAEDALRENEEQFERLFQSSNDGILMHSLYTEKRKPVFIHANDAICRMLGYSIEEMQNLTVYDIVKTEETSDLTHEREALLRDWVLMHQKTLLCKNGRHVPVEINSSVFEHRGDLMALSIVRDITERRKSEDAINNLNVELRQSIGELARTNKELEAFIYSVSHDLRAPLMSIGGFSDFLMREYADKLDARGKEHLSRVMKNAVRMNQTIEDLLNLSRISRHEIRRQEVNLSSLAESITGDMRQTQPNRAINVEIQPGMTVLGDAGLIRIALSNLLRNAWKFTAKTDNARIELGSLQHEDKVEFYVRDNGAGFDQAFSDKLFLPFHRLHSDQEFEGTGIGLAITERVIRRHGGRIRAEGKRNEGASFYFTLQ